eukprot:15472323-Alexandrium_andersonii.AAC.1
MNGEWIIAIGDHDSNQLAKDVAVKFANPEHLHPFRTRLNEIWRTWGGRRSEREAGPTTDGDADPR